MTVKPPEKIARLIPLGPGCLLGFRDKQPALAVLNSLAMRARVTGSLAAVEVRQSFSNPYPEALEFCYLFPLNGALSRFRAQVGDRALETHPTESSENLPENHRPAALGPLFEGETAPVFSVGLGLLEPGQSATVELLYAELLPNLEFCFPLVLSGRLGEMGYPAIQLQILLEAPVARFACNQAVQRQSLDNGDVLLELSASDGTADLVVSQDFRLERPQAVLRQSAQHFLLNVFPPAGQLSSGRDLVIMVDISENATPARFGAAQALVRELLGSLGEEEEFALVGFHHEIEGFEVGTFQKRSRSGAALEWLGQRRPGGRADLTVLLDRVLSLQYTRELTVVLIASGPVGNEPELYAQVCACENAPPFFTVGLGPQVNTAFLRRLGAVTRGGMDTGRPWLRNLGFNDLGLAGQPASLAPARVPHLGLQPLTVLGRKTGQGGLQVNATSYAGQNWSEAAASCTCQNPALGLLWASEKVAEMLDELKLVQGPRASQLRQISQALCREYRLMTDISPLAVAGQRLAPLNPAQWARAPVAPGPKPRPLPPPVLIVKEPSQVRAGLVAPQGATPSPQGLRPKLSKAKKYEPKRRPSKPALKKENPLARARKLLESELALWKAELRALYHGRQAEQMAPLLIRLRALKESSSVLSEVYRVGVACYQGLRAGHPQAGLRTAQWVEKFAGLLR